jgi:hypothetical protein
MCLIHIAKRLWVCFEKSVFWVRVPCRIAETRPSPSENPRSVEIGAGE